MLPVLTPSAKPTLVKQLTALVLLQPKLKNVRGTTTQTLQADIGLNQYLSKLQVFLANQLTSFWQNWANASQPEQERRGKLNGSGNEYR